MLSVVHLEGSSHRADLPALFACARKASIDGVELTLGGDCTLQLAEPEDTCRAIAEEARRCGTRVWSVLLRDTSDVRIGMPEPERRSQNLEVVRGVVERCRWLGAQTLRLVPAGLGGKRGLSGSRMTTSFGDRVVREPECPLPLSYQDALNATCYSLEALRPVLERCGVVAAVMPCHHGFLLSPPEFRELLDRANSPMIAAALDYAACAAVGDPADWITTLQGRLAAVVFDAAAWGVTCGGETLVESLGEVRFDGPWIRPAEKSVPL